MKQDNSYALYSSTSITVDELLAFLQKKYKSVTTNNIGQIIITTNNDDEGVLTVFFQLDSDHPIQNPYVYPASFQLSGILWKLSARANEINKSILIDIAKEFGAYVYPIFEDSLSDHEIKIKWEYIKGKRESEKDSMKGNLYNIIKVDINKLDNPYNILMEDIINIIMNNLDEIKKL